MRIGLLCDIDVHIPRGTLAYAHGAQQVDARITGGTIEPIEN